MPVRKPPAIAGNSVVRTPRKTTSANKTTATDADVASFVARVADVAQRADTEALIALMRRVSEEPPRMWGPSIIGFGRYHYRYESGREGEMCRIGFSPRKGKTALYIKGGFDGHAALMARLGKADKGCVYIKRLADVDAALLEQLCRASLTHMAEMYPE